MNFQNTRKEDVPEVWQSSHSYLLQYLHEKRTLFEELLLQMNSNTRSPMFEEFYPRGKNFFLQYLPLPWKQHLAESDLQLSQSY